MYYYWKCLLYFVLTVFCNGASKPKNFTKLYLYNQSDTKMPESWILHNMNMGKGLFSPIYSDG